MADDITAFPIETVKVSELSSDPTFDDTDKFLVTSSDGVTRYVLGSLIKTWAMTLMTDLEVISSITTVDVTATGDITAASGAVDGLTVSGGSASFGGATDKVTIDSSGKVEYEGTAAEYNPSAVKSAYISGFQREETESLGVMQFCYSAVSGEVHQIDEDGVYTLLTAQTTFADTVTPIADRTFAHWHEPGGSQFYYWIEGERIDIGELKTHQFAVGDEGGYLVYDSLGNLSVPSDVHSTINSSKAIATTITLNPTSLEMVLFADERHGINMDVATHITLHSGLGALWNSGCEPTGLANNSVIWTNVSVGVILDEDIVHHIGVTSVAPTLYRDGALGEWRLHPADNLLSVQDGGGDVQYNENTSGTVWQQTDVGGGNFVIMHLIATNDGAYPIMKILGQGEYASRNDARDALSSEWRTLKLDGLPSPEFVPIASWIIAESDKGIETGSDGEIWVDLRYRYTANAVFT